ncbi:MAG: DUF2188 domain-containing protein [Candidatus Methanoplasma sp.]|nr:DUF2188 domain-containing protein [Candidatus Methanoplasma sp.]
MGLFEKFRKKEEPKKSEAHKKEVMPEKNERDAAWATSRKRPVEETEEDPDEYFAEREKKPVKQTKKKPINKTKGGPEMAGEKKTDGKVWHITKRDDDGMWQVRAEGAAKATKLFRTKAEAEEYVKTLLSNNEGSRVVKHKKTGEFQKK